MAAPRQDPRATSSISRTEQEVFAQRKLEDLFKNTYQRLYEYRNAVGFGQEVLVWQRPLAAALLYAAIHWVFIYFVKCEDSVLTQLFTLLFWALLGDALWRVATRTPNSGGRGLNSAGGERDGHVRRKSVPKEVSFEAVLIQGHSPKGPQELVSFEVFCLRVAGVLMWLDNCWLALRHWSVHEPVVFSVVLAVPGVVLSILGKYIPTIVVAYVSVMVVVVWPYIEYHGLLPMAVEYVHIHFPQLILKAKAMWAFLKKHAVSQDEEIPPELTLGGGVGDEDETQTRRALAEAYERPSPDRAGMSLLQDSFLGLRLETSVFPNPELDSLSTSSLALGPGDFPSISPSHQPQNSRQTSPPHEHHQPPMPTIEEEDDDTQETYSGNSDELDPFADSVEVEFGLNFTDSRLGHLHRQPPRPNVYTNRSNASETFGQRVYGAETHHTSPPPPHHTSPPPPYESIVGSNSGNDMMPPQYVPPVYGQHYSPGYGGVQMPYGSPGFGPPQFPPGSTTHGSSLGFGPPQSPPGSTTHGSSLGYGPPQFPPGSTTHGNSNPDPEGMIPTSSSTPLMEAYPAQGRELRHRSSDSNYQYH